MGESWEEGGSVGQIWGGLETVSKVALGSLKCFAKLNRCHGRLRDFSNMDERMKAAQQVCF